MNSKRFAIKSNQIKQKIFFVLDRCLFFTELNNTITSNSIELIRHIGFSIHKKIKTKSNKQTNKQKQGKQGILIEKPP